jgi:ABC-2 type transport system ATP-binding protein
MIPATDTFLLEARDVRYRYRASGPWALDGISLRLGRGVVLGIVGPNGSGKTTLFRLILGLMSPQHGTIAIDGEPARTFRCERGVGYLPEQVRLPPAVRVRELARFAGRLAGLSAAQLEPTIEGGLIELGLEARAEARVGTLSHGYRQRVGLLVALLGDPELLILDEPANGLDPESNGMLRSVLRRLKRQGRALIVSSHNLLELERLYDEVLVLNSGRELGRMTRAELARQSDVSVVQLEVALPESASLAVRCRELNGVVLAGDEIAFSDRVRAQTFANEIMAEGVSVDSIEQRPFDLECLFHTLIGRRGAEDRCGS